MGTFNAGAIEANLTLGRSDWKSDLTAVKREIQDLENTAVTISIDADADNARIAMDNIELFLEDLDSKTYTPSIDLDVTEANATLDALEARLDELGARTVTVGADADTDNAMIQLSLLEDQMDLLESDPVTIEADADIAAAMANLSALEAAASAIAAETVNIDVDVDDVITALEEMLMLEAAIIAVDGNDIDIDVNYDRDAIEGLVGTGAGMGGGGGGSLGLLKILLISIIGLLPILTMLIGVSTAGIVAFAGAIVGAIGPVAILAAGLVGLVARFKEAQDAGDGLTRPMQVLDNALDDLSDAWNAFLDDIAVEGFTLMGDAVLLLAEILPSLAPLFNETADMIRGVLDSVRDFVNSSEYDEMLGFFGGFGIDMLETFLGIGGNLLRFFGRLFDAIAPFARVMMQGLEDATAGWAEWADDLENNESFQHFIDNAMEYGPDLLEMLWAMIEAFMAIGHALEPFAGPAIEGLTDFFNFIADMDPDTLGWLIVILGGMYIALTVVVPLISSLVGGLSAIATAAGFISIPVLAVVAALAAFAFILWQTWQDSEKFRDIVTDAFEDTKDTVLPIVEDIVRFIKENWGPLKDWIQETWDEYGDVIVEAAEFWGRVIKGVLIAITALWNAHGSDWLRIIKGVFQIIGGLIGGWIKILHGLFILLNGILTGDWNRIWEGIRTIAQGGAQVVTGIIRGLGNVIGGLFSAASRTVRGFWSEMWGGIGRMASSGVSGIVRTVSGLVSMITGMISGIQTAIQNVKDGINSVIGRWNSLEFGVPGFDPPGPGPSLPGFTIGTPDIPYLARGGLAYDATLAVVGDNPGPEPEVIAPLSNLRSMLGDSVGQIDYDRLASAVSAALESMVSRVGLNNGGITREDLERLIEAAGVQVDIDARGADATGLRALPAALTFEIRRLGFGGKANA